MYRQCLSEMNLQSGEKHTFRVEIFDIAIPAKSSDENGNFNLKCVQRLLFCFKHRASVFIGTFFELFGKYRMGRFGRRLHVRAMSINLNAMINFQSFHLLFLFLPGFLRCPLLCAAGLFSILSHYKVCFYWQICDSTHLQSQRLSYVVFVKSLNVLRYAAFISFGFNFWFIYL